MDISGGWETTNKAVSCPEGHLDSAMPRQLRDGSWPPVNNTNCVYIFCNYKICLISLPKINDIILWKLHLFSAR